MNESSSLDISSIETLKGLMKDRFNFLIETFFTNTTSQLEDLQTAIDNNDMENIISITHGIKGSSGSVGAACVHQLCKIYEEKARKNDINDKEDWAKLLTTEFDRYKVDIQSHL
jgi:HPt (histidine-containing phosphotransfer) domain-containing protein